MKTLPGQKALFEVSDSDAVFSECRQFRYWLLRRWGRGGRGQCTFICLNPSTADETANDPTVTRCINYAKDWGFSSFVMLNLFDFRATEPADMMRADDPVGPDNDEWLLRTCEHSGLVVAAWGAHGGHLDRDREVLKLLEDMDVHYLSLTKNGSPRHPLYLKKNLKPVRWEDRR